jgi:hypothetical protein
MGTNKFLVITKQDIIATNINYITLCIVNNTIKLAMEVVRTSFVEL